MKQTKNKYNEGTVLLTIKGLKNWDKTDGCPCISAILNKEEILFICSYLGGPVQEYIEVEIMEEKMNGHNFDQKIVFSKIFAPGDSDYEYLTNLYNQHHTYPSYANA